MTDLVAHLTETSSATRRQIAVTRIHPQRQQQDETQEKQQSRLLHQEYQAAVLCNGVLYEPATCCQDVSSRAARSTIPSPKVASIGARGPSGAGYIAFTRGQGQGQTVGQGNILQTELDQARCQRGAQVAALRSEVAQAMSQAANPAVQQEMQALRARRDQLQTEVTHLHQQLQQQQHQTHSGVMLRTELASTQENLSQMHSTQLNSTRAHQSALRLVETTQASLIDAMQTSLPDCQLPQGSIYSSAPSTGSPPGVRD
eukprot:6480239-Amphidinium_carterae.2